MPPLFLDNAGYFDVFMVAYAIWALPEIVGSFTQRSQAGASKRDRGSQFVLLFTLYAGLFAGFWLAFRLQGAAIVWARPLVIGAGIALMLLGVALRWYAIRVLGRYFTRDVAVSAGQMVVQTGPYRFIRHSAYSGSLLTVLGLGLALGNWASLAAILAGAIAGYTYRVSVEERALREALRQPYLDYLRRTRRFIPFIF